MKDYFRNLSELVPKSYDVKQRSRVKTQFQILKQRPKK